MKDIIPDESLREYVWLTMASCLEGRNKEEKFHGDGNKHFYLGNKNLPRSSAEFEWTPQMVAQLKKSRKNILHFAEN